MLESIKQKIVERLNEKLADTDQFLVDVKVLPDNTIRIFVDSDSGMTIENCAVVSRYLEKSMNEETDFSEKYALEVSSPGLDQPLKNIRQYKKNIGRSVDVLLNDGVKKSGMLLFADEDKIIIEELKMIKHKIQDRIQTEIPLINIKSTTVTITFKI